MISKEHRCIYIHIPKTAGTSIEKKLGHFETLKQNIQDHRTVAEIELLTDRKQHLKNSLYSLKLGKWNRAPLHARNALTPQLTEKEFQEYYKFSFVRNSWSRMYSWYRNVLKDDFHRRKYNIVDPNYSFEEFIKTKVDPNRFSQLYYLTNKKGNVNMDFIGRFENLNADFKKVAGKLDLEDSHLPKLLMWQYNHYTEFYNATTKDLVYKLFKDEIDYFNFEYGE